MVEHADTTLHHLLLLGIQIACLNILAGPYLEAFKAGRFNEDITKKPWGFGRFFGNFAAVSLFWVHLLIWAQEPNAPSEVVLKTIFLFYGWTAMLALWSTYRYKQIKKITQ